MISLQGGRNSYGQLRRFASLIAARYEIVARKDTVVRSEVFPMRIVCYVIVLLALSSLSAVTCRTVLASDPTFNHPADYPVGSEPRSICGADFDGDLDNDLAVINHGDSSVSVLINNGDGTFQSAVNYAVDGSPVDIVAADFIGDSHIDLAVTLGVSNAISILVGNGDGTFQDTVYHVANLSSGPSALWTGDSDNDGDNDLAVAGGMGYETSFMRGYVNNAPDLDFWEDMINYEGYSPWDLVSADFNGDDNDDLVVLDFLDQEIYVYLSSGMWGWFNDWWPMFGAHFDQISCADVNGDSAVDIIGAYYGVNCGYGIFLGYGNGFFDAGSYTVTESIGPTDRLYVADLDDDGNPDIALTGTNIDSVLVVVNDGSGSFSSPSAHYTGGMGTFIFAIELNGDNANDLVVSHNALNTVSVLINGSHTAVEDNDSATLPETYWLSCNYPNPFNPQTTIAYDLPGEATVTLNVFDASGRLVRELVDGEVLTAGRYETMWNGRNDAGRQVASGVYFYCLEAGVYSETKRMVLLK